MKAENIPGDAAEEFRKESSLGSETGAENVLARSLLAEGKLADAQAAITRASALSRKTPDIPLRIEVAHTATRVSGAGKNHSCRNSIVQAKKNLESSQAEAHKYGFLEYEYKFRLALGEIEIKSGNLREGEARLEALAKAANAKGFGLIVRETALAASTQLPQPE